MFGGWKKRGESYLAKYLVREGRPECFRAQTALAALAGFDCKVKGVAVESGFTEAIKFCQQELSKPNCRSCSSTVKRRSAVVESAVFALN